MPGSIPGRNANEKNLVYPKTRLQIILSSITAHSQGLSQGFSPLDISQVVDKAIENIPKVLGPEETEEEVEEREKEKEAKHKSWQQRIQGILKNFIRRYLRGLRSTDFIRWAGCDVITIGIRLWHAKIAAHSACILRAHREQHARSPASVC